jgi:hypothetical protein
VQLCLKKGDVKKGEERGRNLWGRKGTQPFSLFNAEERKKGDATFFPIQRAHSAGSILRSRLKIPCRVHALEKDPDDLQGVAAVTDYDRVRTFGAAVQAGAKIVAHLREVPMVTISKQFACIFPV